MKVAKLSAVLIALLYVLFSLYNKKWDAMQWSQDSTALFGLCTVMSITISAICVVLNLDKFK